MSSQFLGCLRCDVTWRGERKCWVCSDTQTFIVGAWAINASRRDGMSVTHQYFETEEDQNWETT